MKISVQKGYLNRIRIYLDEMYPVPVRLINAFLLYTSFNILISGIHDLPVNLFSTTTMVGTLSLFSILLILRLMDELKDKEIDLQLFNDRSLPSGKVLESDIKFTLILLIIFFIGVNLWSRTALWSALFVLGYSLLMFKYFFLAKYIRDNLLLNLVTHNPIIPFIIFYLLTLFIHANNLSLSNVNWLVSIVILMMYWLLFFSWEITRKIKAPEEENAYITYSQLLTPKGAVITGLFAQTIVMIIGLYLFTKLSFPQLYINLVVVVYIILLFGYIRFLKNPNSMTSKLSPFTEHYIYGFFVIITFHHLLRFGKEFLL